MRLLQPTLFRAPLDPEEREPKLRLKIAKCREDYAGIPFRDPYDGILSVLRENPLFKSFKEAKGLEVEPWLLPAPDPKYLPLLTVENMVAFIDSDGCREYAGRLEALLKSEVLPALPVMLGVDHSLTGGCVKALTSQYDASSLSLIVLDSHFDAITPSLRCGLIQYDLETNPDSPFDPSDPYIKGRIDSYNADSFLYYLVEEEVLPVENILVLGVSDYPPPHAFQIEDARVRSYLEHYKGLEESGVKVLSKERLRKDWDRVSEILASLKAEYFYVSVDIDVGSRRALEGARFLDYEGLGRGEIYRLAELLKRKIAGRLVGLDLMETDVFTAGAERNGRRDETYLVEAELLRILLSD